MKKIILGAFLLLSSLSFAEIKSTLSIPHDKISFKYQSYDGEITYICKHNDINEWNDLEVYCGMNREKVYTVHLVLSAYKRKTIPKTSFELLYWVTDSKAPHDKNGFGSTIWTHLNEEATFNEFNVSVSVDNDMAGLYLSLKSF